MSNMEKTIENIKNNLYSDDKTFYESIIPLYKYLIRKTIKYSDYFKFNNYIRKKIITIINNNFNSKEKIIFYLKASLIDFKYDNTSFPKYIFKDSINEYMNKHEQKFLKILNEEEIQELYANWFIKTGFNNCLENEIYEKIFNLPKFKKIVLENEKFILENLFLDLDFYEKLPKEYGYLIGLINAKNIPIKLTFNIYNMCFDNIIKKSTQLKLLKAGIQMDNTDYSFGIEKDNKRLEFAHCLKKIYNNKEYYNILKKLSKKTKLDLSYIISFSDKYDNTDFFINICSKRKLAKNEINKIKYLAISEKIVDNNIIENLYNISLNDLINSEKKDSIKVGIYGGPISQNDNNPLFSPNSNSKEIRRINVDGSINIKSMDFYGSHSSGFDYVYNELEFNYDDTVFEKSITAIKKINSITFIIEGEACLIVMPKSISNDQKIILIDWINKANNETNIGISIYDKTTNKNEILLCNEIGKDDIIEYINNLSNNEKKYTYNM